MISAWVWQKRHNPNKCPGMSRQLPDKAMHTYLKNCCLDLVYNKMGQSIGRDKNNQLVLEISDNKLQRSRLLY